MYILAIHGDTNANISVYKNEQLLFSIAEERLTRIRHKAGYPEKTIAFIFSYLGIGWKDLGAVIYGNRYHIASSILGRKFPTYEHSFLGPAQNARLIYHHLLCKSYFFRNSIGALNKTILGLKLDKRIEFYDHHVSHAYAAYMTSGLPEATVIVIDNFGDGLSSSVFSGNNGYCKFIYGSSALNSPGQFYGEIAQLLGFHPLFAGKVTALAAFGNPQKAYSIAKKIFGLREDRRDFKVIPILSKMLYSGLYRQLMKFNKEDVAAAIQKRFEEILVDYVREAFRTTNCAYLALSGGVFANVKLNQRIKEIKEVKEVFIHPAMDDQGISLGAALAYQAKHNHLRPYRLKDVFFGIDFVKDDIETELKKEGLTYEFYSNIDEQTALLLSKGCIVARFTGRMEYGPRALGNRSILYQTTNPSANLWLNKKLARNDFMPFAPVTLEEEAGTCYRDLEKARYSAKFMTITFDCTERMKTLSPGTVHIDGTARPQLLSKNDDPSFYRLLETYYRLTGIPSLLNTSFNIHGEPIVSSPKDAIKTFKMTDIDYLAIGPFLVRKKES